MNNASPIRELARRHATGELSQEEYRAKRHALIEDIVSGRQVLNYEERRPARTPNPGSARLTLIAGSLVVVIIIVIMTIWATSMRSHAIPAAKAQASTPLPSGISPGPLLVQNFLGTNDWSNQSIQNFIHEWKELPSRERELARNDYRFPRLTSELHQQIVSQQAMSDLTKNAGTAKAELTGLEKMADTLGVSEDN